VRSVNLDTLVFTIFGSLKVIGLMAAISAILVLNWLTYTTAPNGEASRRGYRDSLS
jgi:hypothetical protein